MDVPSRGMQADKAAEEIDAIATKSPLLATKSAEVALLRSRVVGALAKRLRFPPCARILAAAVKTERLFWSVISRVTAALSESEVLTKPPGENKSLLKAILHQSNISAGCGNDPAAGEGARSTKGTEVNLITLPSIVTAPSL